MVEYWTKGTIIATNKLLELNHQLAMPLRVVEKIVPFRTIHHSSSPMFMISDLSPCKTTFHCSIPLFQSSDCRLPSEEVRHASQNADSACPFLPSRQYKKGHTESAFRDACRTSSGLPSWRLPLLIKIYICYIAATVDGLEL